MLKAALSWIGMTFAGAVYAHAAQVPPASLPQTPAAQYRALLDRYCATCHNEKLRTADLVLSNLSVGNVSRDIATWEKVVEKLRSGAMPPAGMPRPDKAAYNSLATYLEAELDRAAEAHPNPGRPAIHRLNRTEYTNAIRDLLGLEIDGAALLPGDDASYGFDNIGDVLTLSATLLERYMSAAEKISRRAIGDPKIRPVLETYGISQRLEQDDRASEALPFGSRGGLAIPHYFPLDAEYSIRVRLKRDRVLDIIGLAEPHRLDIRLDGARIKLFTVGGEGEKTDPADIEDAGPAGYKKKVNDSGQERYERVADAGLEVRFPAKAGEHVVGVAFLHRTSEPEGVLRRRAGLEQYAQEDDIPGVGSVTIGGPYDAKGVGETSSREKIFVCHPSARKEEEACARKILSTLARRAYRGAATDADTQTLFGFYREGRNTGGFEAGIELALRRALVSSKFLFRMEHDPVNEAPGTVHRISDLELASRLSFFLWSSIPDEELLDLASRGKLGDPAVLERQVRRMLDDPRAESLVTNFAGQWLYLRNIQKVTPDPETFPEFDENLRRAFQRETELFLESMLREDRSALDLLNADYTFLNERLARHYGIPNIYGSQFRRVTLADENRKGLIGQGSILTVTSYASRTSPTLRGKWLLDNILGSPPPAPPNNVPSLPDRGQDGKILSVRQLMEQHRANPACAGCHAQMDPLGFALENFDAIGRWRTTSGAANTPIDASGVLPDGAKFNGPAELRKILLDRREEFVRTVTDKLLTYALGRGIEYYDAPAVRKIVREAAPGDYRWSALILGVVKSTPFQMRRSPQP
jgi:mono/diheme cytochrome c family protein